MLLHAEALKVCTFFHGVALTVLGMCALQGSVVTAAAGAPGSSSAWMTRGGRDERRVTATHSLFNSARFRFRSQGF